MIEEVYLIRHGKVNKQIQPPQLNSEGIKFSEELLQYFNDNKIDFIISGKEKRCKDTVLPLIKKMSIPTLDYDKNKSIIPTKLFHILSTHKIIVICFTKESKDYLEKMLDINNLEDLLGINFSIKSSSDKLYNRIWPLVKENDKWSSKPPINIDLD